MNSCKEFALDDVMAITAIPIGDMILGASSWQLSPTILSSGFSPVLTNAITIGLQPATVGGSLIPIIRKTGKTKDEESDSVAGRKHTVTANCEVDDRDSDVWSLLHQLEITPCHLLLTFRDNTRAFVCGTQDSYLCETERDGARTSVSFRMECLFGIQLIV